MALAQLEDEHPNLRAALGWAIDQADIAGAARMALALWRFWLVHSHLREERQWLERVVTLVEQADAARELVPAVDRATLLHVTGNLARAQGDYTQTVALFEAGLAIRRSIGDAHGIGVSLHNLGAVAYEQGDYSQAARLNREALALMHQLKDAHGIAITLLDLGDALAGQGDKPGAAGSYAESLALFRDLEHTWGIARVLLRSGDLARRQRNTGRAQACFTESLTLSLQLADQAWVAANLEGRTGWPSSRSDGSASRGCWLRLPPYASASARRWRLSK